MHQPHNPLTEPTTAVDADDQELLREYVATGAETAFARLVDRHVDLVYSAAFRQTGNHAMAQDVAQAVFTILARKAASIRRETVLAGWLFRAVRYAALDARKIEARRHTREQEAAQMQLTDSSDDTGNQWEEFAPLLDEALAALGTKDRHAILLRFFEKKRFGEIGKTLGGNENSARVRVARAAEKLRAFFRRRGVAVSAAALSGALLSNAVHAAPPALASSIASRTTGASLAEALLRRLLWRRVVRVGAAIVVFLLLGGGATLAVRQRQVAQAAELAEAARSVRNLMIAIDRTYTLNDPNGFVALIYFRNALEKEFGPVLADYVRAQWLFRQEMQRAFNVRQRTFDATFRELCVWQPAEPTSYIRSDSAATNIMMARYPVRFVKAGGAWKWDLFDGLSPEMRTQRVAILRHKTAVLDKLTGQVRDRAATNVVDILETIQSATP
jgi:RNA polymerase sigma factor (sigma-70 family)